MAVIVGLWLVVLIASTFTRRSRRVAEVGPEYPPPPLRPDQRIPDTDLREAIPPYTLIQSGPPA